MKYVKHYNLGHTYTFEYLPAEYFCPDCGQLTVWEEQGIGDYYLGNEFVCASCGLTFYAQFFEGDKELLEQLRGQKANPQ